MKVIMTMVILKVKKFQGILKKKKERKKRTKEGSKSSSSSNEEKNTKKKKSVKRKTIKMSDYIKNKSK